MGHTGKLSSAVEAHGTISEARGVGQRGLSFPTRAQI